jgi:hypothetical protein
LPQLQGAYHDPKRTDEAFRATCELEATPALHPDDCRALVRLGRVVSPAVRGKEEN